MDGLKARLSFDAVAYDYDDEYLTIDTDTHTININNVSRLFGVQYDGNSKLIKFRIRNKLSDIQKMQDSIVYINWIDARGVKGQSIAINKSISNDICEFAWKVPFDALKNSGVLHFAMSAVVTKNSSSVIDQRWSTRIASVITPDGIYIKSYTPSSEEEDRIAQIYNELSNMINKQNDNLSNLQVQVSSLKEDLVNEEHLTSVLVQNKTAEFNKNGYINKNGVLVETENAENTGYINIVGVNTIRCSANMIKYGYAIALYDINRKILINESVLGNGIGVYEKTVPSNARYAIISNFGTHDKHVEFIANSNNIPNELNVIKEKISKKIKPLDTTFFMSKEINQDEFIFAKNNYPNNDCIIISGNNLNSIIVPIPSDTLTMVFQENIEINRRNVVMSKTSTFNLGETYPLVSSKYYYENGNVKGITIVNTNTDYKYAMIYFNNGYDLSVEEFNQNKYDYHLYIGDKRIEKPTKLKSEYLPEYIDVFNGMNLLIFGDSITDTCDINIVNDKTTSYKFRSPSNSYVNEQEKTIYFDMWPKLLKDMFNFNEIRNYAKSGASYKYSNRADGNERQNVSYQIEVALNDLTNPNGVFKVNDFKPDVVIFALGTNDGANSNDTYESAMAKSYADLDKTKFCESVRYSFETIKRKFPTALIIVELPIQRADSDVIEWNTVSLLKKIAERYSCIVVNSATKCGIIKDNNVWGSLGVTLKDGLHPNEVGQNLLTRMFIKIIEQYYINFDNMN